MSGTLYLIPVPISSHEPLAAIPDHNRTIVCRLRHFIAEDARTARRHLKTMGYEDLSVAEIALLNEHTRSGDIMSLMKPLLDGYDTGLMSDAGCPGIADPGAEVTRIAHKLGITVTPLTGPSAIVLSVMASGFNGQNFAFSGYLPVDKAERAKRIRELELLSQKHRQAQFFIETPYRNAAMMDALLVALQPATLLFIGLDIGSERPVMLTKPVGEWKKARLPDMHKIPAVFGIYPG